MTLTIATMESLVSRHRLALASACLPGPINELSWSNMSAPFETGRAASSCHRYSNANAMHAMCLESRPVDDPWGWLTLASQESLGSTSFVRLLRRMHLPLGAICLIE